MTEISKHLVPTFDQMLIPTVQALQNLGGSGTIKEIYEQVSQLLNLSDEVLSVPHVNSTVTEVEYRLGWCRTYLKKYGLLQNSSRGVWSLSTTHLNLQELDPREIVKFVRESDKNKRSIPQPKTPSLLSIVEEKLEEASWHQQLYQILINLDPSAFERLIQRFLRESGFIQVHVTGKTGDGDIHGVGIAQINGLLSFHVLFQCKRYQGSVTASHVRDFRGAMQGRTDKGLLITTGTFTRDAVREATRDGAPLIDLIDGEQLIQRFKDLELGIRIRTVELVEVDADWFDNL